MDIPCDADVVEVLRCHWSPHICPEEGTAWHAVEVDGAPCRIPAAWASFGTCAEAEVDTCLDRTVAVELAAWSVVL